jgi:hypothetical protein
LRIPAIFRRRLAAPAIVAALATGGCFTGLGPQAIRTERSDYNEQIAGSGDRELLLNLVRLRYNDSPLFLELGAVVTQYGMTASLSASGHIDGSGTGNANAATGLGYSESPTVTYTPLAGEDFATRMLTPIPLDAIMLFEQSGWSAERLLLIGVQRVNDVFNAPTAGGPTPEHEPDYEAFAALAERLQRLRLAGLFGLNWEPKSGEKQPPGRDPRFWIRALADPDNPLAADVAAVRRSLGLEPGKEEFPLTAFPFGRRRSEVGLRCRSLLGVLYFLSTAVEPPAADVEAGLVTVTKDEQGRPFDWSKVTGKVMRIRSQEERPDRAYLAVQHRGWWFYIADDDQSSKTTFSLLNILFSLQSASGKGKSPLLTLPIGR